MTDLRKAAEMALEALQDVPYMSNEDDWLRHAKVVTALIKAIKQSDSEGLITQSELANRWRISEATLERDRSLNKGCRYVKIGHSIRYRLADVEAYENECTVETSK